jgi:hypothetical protein
MRPGYPAVVPAARPTGAGRLRSRPLALFLSSRRPYPRPAPILAPLPPYGPRAAARAMAFVASPARLGTFWSLMSVISVLARRLLPGFLFFPRRDRSSRCRRSLSTPPRVRRPPRIAAPAGRVRAPRAAAPVETLCRVGRHCPRAGAVPVGSVPVRGSSPCRPLQCRPPGLRGTAAPRRPPLVTPRVRLRRTWNIVATSRCWMG